MLVKKFPSMLWKKVNKGQNCQSDPAILFYLNINKMLPYNVLVKNKSICFSPVSYLSSWQVNRWVNSGSQSYISIHNLIVLIKKDFNFSIKKFLKFNEYKGYKSFFQKMRSFINCVILSCNKNTNFKNSNNCVILKATFLCVLCHAPL